MKLIVLLVLCISLILSTLAIFDGGHYRHNRLYQSDVVDALNHFSIVSVSSNHFRRSIDGLQSQSTHHSTDGESPWVKLHELAKDVSIPLSDAPFHSQSSSASFIHEFNSLLSQDTWGGWSPTNSYTPLESIVNDVVEPMEWDHPEVSSLSFTLGDEQITLELTKNADLFAPNYRVEIHRYDEHGVLTDRQFVHDQPTTCYYTATITSIQSLTQKDGGDEHQTLHHAQSLFSNQLSVPKSQLLSSRHRQQTHSSSTHTLQNNNSDQQDDDISIYLPFSSLGVSPSNTTNTPVRITSPINAFDSCRGGFTGSFQYKNTTYNIMPAVNHLPAQAIAALVAQIETSPFASMSRGNDSDAITASSLHILVDTTKDMEHPFIQAMKDSKRRLAEVSGNGSGDHDHSDSDDNDNDDHHHPHNMSYCGHDHSLDTTLLKDARQLEDLIHQSTSDRVFQSNVDDNSNNPQFSPQQLPSQLYLEWMLVTDSRRLSNLHREQALTNAASLANYVKTYYSYHNTNPPAFATPIEVILVSQLLLETDPWESRIIMGEQSGQCQPGPHEVCSHTLLSEFQAYRTQLQGTTVIDNMHLLSGHDFDQSTLGLATIGQMCNSHASAVNQVHGSGNTSFFAIVLAHELGHNFSSYHDAQVGTSESCPSGVNIMSPSLNPNSVDEQNTRFSSCSIGMINQFLTRPNVITCLANRPIHRWGDPVCGNGFLEAGETCDCGRPDCSDIDPCCNGVLCQLYSETVIDNETVSVQCSSLEPCCTETCQYRPSDFECRHSFTSCDTPEYCTGSGGSCPIDVGKGSGHDCDIDGDPGLCFLGVCTNEHITCQNLGIQQGIPNLTGCDNVNKNDPDYCASLQCYDPRRGACIGFSSNGVPLMMDNGVSCGPDGQGRQCYQGRCVSMNDYEPAYRWLFNEWEPCSACGETQVRSAECVNINTNEIQSDTTVCSAPKSVHYSLIRPCNNVELGCVYSQSAEDSRPGKAYFFGAWIPKRTIALIFVGIILFYLALSALCYRCVTSPVKGMKDMSDRIAREIGENGDHDENDHIQADRT